MINAKTFRQNEQKYFYYKLQLYFRILNLELLSDFGANAWKSYNTVLSQMVEMAQRQLQELRFVYIYMYISYYGCYGYM